MNKKTLFQTGPLTFERFFFSFNKEKKSELKLYDGYYKMLYKHNGKDIYFYISPSNYKKNSLDRDRLIEGKNYIIEFTTDFVRGRNILYAENLKITDQEISNRLRFYSLERLINYGKKQTKNSTDDKGYFNFGDIDVFIKKEQIIELYIKKKINIMDGKSYYLEGTIMENNKHTKYKTMYDNFPGYTFFFETLSDTPLRERLFKEEMDVLMDLSMDELIEKLYEQKTQNDLEETYSMDSDIDKSEINVKIQDEVDSLLYYLNNESNDKYGKDAN